MSYDDIVLLHTSPLNNKAIMLFHGLTGSPYELKKYAKILFDEGYDVYCYCLPGHGNHRINIFEVKMKDWTNFASEKFRCLRGYYEYFYVGGLCLGAVLALYLAEKYKSITGLVCLSTTFFLDGWTIPKYNFLLPLGLSTILKHYFVFPEREPFGVKNRITRRRIEKLMQNNTVALDYYPLSAIGELLKLSKLVRKNIKIVNSPILIIHSIEDDLTSIKSANFTFDNISSKIKERVILSNSYHLILYDNEREFVYKRTLEFLNSPKGPVVFNQELKMKEKVLK